MEAKELRNQVVNKLWSYGKLPNNIQALMTDNEVEFMLEVINTYVAEQLAIDDVSVPKGTLSFDKLIDGIAEYEHGQRTHTIPRTPERMRTILAATHNCKRIAQAMTEEKDNAL